MSSHYDHELLYGGSYEPPEAENYTIIEDSIDCPKCKGTIAISEVRDRITHRLIVDWVERCTECGYSI